MLLNTSNWMCELKRSTLSTFREKRFRSYNASQVLNIQRTSYVRHYIAFWRNICDQCVLKRSIENVKLYITVD